MAELSRGQILKNPEVIGAGTTGAFIRLLDADENSHIDIKVPDTVGTAYTFTLPNSSGTTNQVLQTDGSGTTTWTTIDLSPAGSDTYIQFNDGGSTFGGDVDLTWNKTTNLLDINGNLQLKATGELRFADTDSSNYVAFKSPGTVAANRTYTLPAVIGNTGQVLKVSATRTDTAATLEWANDETGAGGSSASGGVGDIQISDGAGNFTSDTDLNFDTANTRLNIGDNTDAAGNLFVEGTVLQPVRFKVTDAGAAFGPILGLYRESSSPAGSDGLGYMYYYGAYSITAPPSTTQNYAYAVVGTSIEDPVQDSTTSGSYGPCGKFNIYITTRDTGTAQASRIVDYSRYQLRHSVNWPVSNGLYAGFRYEVTTSQGGGTNNITPNASSALMEYYYQGNIRLQLNLSGVLTSFGYDIADSDASNFVGIRVPASVTSNYNITLPAAGGAANDILQFDGSQNASFVSNTRTLNFIIDGGGSAITTGSKGFVVLDGDYTVTGWTILADQSGSIVVDVNRATYTDFPTFTNIDGTEPPTLSSGQKAEDLSLSSWTTTLSARDVLEFNVASATTVTRVTVALRLVPR